MWAPRLHIFICASVCSCAKAYRRVPDKPCMAPQPAASQEGPGSSKRMAGSAVEVWTGTQVSSTSALGKSCNFSVPLQWSNISQKFRPHILCMPSSRTPGFVLESLQVPFAGDSRKDHSPKQQSMVFTSCPVLTGPRAPAWAVSCLVYSKACCCSRPSLEPFFSHATRQRELRVWLSSGIYIFQKPRAPRKAVFPSCWSVGRWLLFC